MSVLRLEELTAPALDALDRSRTLAIVGVSPLEQHGPHLPVGADYLAARHFAEAIGERIVARRPGWTVVLTPTLPLGSFEARHRRSPFWLVPPLHTDFWPVAGTALAAGLAGLWLSRPTRRRPRTTARPGTGSPDPTSAAEKGASPR